MMTMYNTNYLRFELLNVHFADLGVVVWKNLGHMLYGMGGLVFPLELDSFLWQLVRMTLAVGDPPWSFAALAQSGSAAIPRDCASDRGGIAGVAFSSQPEADVSADPAVRRGLDLGRRQLRAHGPVGSGAPDAEPTGRCVGDQRRGGRGSSGGRLDARIHALAYSAGYGPRQPASTGGTKADYDWINQHVDAKAAILAYNPSLYLYTGRPTASQTLLPIYWYRGDTGDAIAAFRDLPAYATENRLAYLYIRDSEYGKTLEPAEAQEARRAVETNPALRVVLRPRSHLVPGGDAPVFVRPVSPPPDAIEGWHDMLFCRSNGAEDYFPDGMHRTRFPGCGVSARACAR